MDPFINLNPTSLRSSNIVLRLGELTITENPIKEALIRRIRFHLKIGTTKAMRAEKILSPA